MPRTRVDVAAAAVEWSDCGGGRGSAGIRSSNLGKNMTKTPKPETESDLEREYHRNRSRKRKNSKQLNLPYGNLIIMNLKNSTQRIEPQILETTQKTLMKGIPHIHSHPDPLLKLRFTHSPA